MKSIIFLIAVCILLTGCFTSTKYYKQGDYYNATLEAAKKLRSKPGNEKNILILEKAYPKGIKQYRDEINYLQKEGKPDRWEKIAKHYDKLKTMQKTVEQVTPIKYNGREISFEKVDYDKEIIESRKNAADYLYAHAKKLLESDIKKSYREAYYELINAKSYNATLTDIDKLIERARDKGTTYVKVAYIDNTPQGLPTEFGNELMTFGAKGLDDEWTLYTISPGRTNQKFDYTINVVIQNVAFTPEQIKDTEKTYRDKILDGWEYELDNKGNVKKDSLGNDLKRQKYRNIKCTVTESNWFKATRIDGIVEFTESKTNRKLQNIPITGETVFDHIFYRATGDLKALPREIKQNLDVSPLPFPADIDMIFGTIGVLKAQTYDIIRNNKRIIN